MTLKELQAAAERRGADAMQNRIVAWLREIADDPDRCSDIAAAYEFARRIEKGEHECTAAPDAAGEERG
jgi:hypothetical protein